MSATPRYSTPRYSTPRPWASLSDAEYAVLAPFFASPRGRPIQDLRGRLDAVFWVVTSPHPWRLLPPEMGKPDSISRQFRRWAHAGVWSRLLRAVAAADAPAVLRRLEHWICRAFRRAHRILQLGGVVLARRLGLASAVRAPFWMLPDPDLSDKLMPIVLSRLQASIHGPRARLLRALELGRRVHRLVGGRLHLPRRLAPP